MASAIANVWAIRHGHRWADTPLQIIFWTATGGLFCWIAYSTILTLRAVWAAIRGRHPSCTSHETLP